MARDLRQEIYPYFRPKIMPTLLRLLDTKDTDQLEEAFSCFAYLFKFLLKFVLQDFTLIFDDLIQTLGDRMWYIRQFCAEVLSFILRKLPDDRLREGIDHVLTRATDDSVADPRARAAIMEGASLLLFMSVKGIQMGFHSRLAPTLLLLVDLTDAADPPRRPARFAVALGAVLRVCEHCRAEQAGAMWEALLAPLDALLDRPPAELAAAPALRTASRLLAVCVAHRSLPRA
jgi:hypothetical protein